jgi:hypothetical protein
MLTLPSCSLKRIHYIQRFTSRYIFNHYVAPMLLLSCKSGALYEAWLTARKIRMTAACETAPLAAAPWRLDPPLDLRVNVEVSRYFRYTVSMDVIRLDHHVSDTTYVCCIPSISRAVSRICGIRWWSNAVGFWVLYCRTGVQSRALSSKGESYIVEGYSRITQTTQGCSAVNWSIHMFWHKGTLCRASSAEARVQTGAWHVTRYTVQSRIPTRV